MPFSVGVRLPKSRTPLFPPLCVGCRADHPAHGVTLWSFGGSWWSFFVPVLIFFNTEVAKVRAPFCRRRAWTTRLRKLAFMMICAALVVGAIWLARDWFPRAPKLVRKLVWGGAVLAALFPALLWHVLRPPAISVDPQGDHVVYEFRDWVYAHQFAELNEGRVETD